MGSSYLNWLSSQIAILTTTTIRTTSMTTFSQDKADLKTLIDAQGSNWSAISADSAARMRLQNRFQTGLEIAKYTAGIMRQDMKEYDADPSCYTQSLGCWHGFNSHF